MAAKTTMTTKKRTKKKRRKKGRGQMQTASEPSNGRIHSLPPLLENNLMGRPKKRL